jgi:TusA-related sulfurtransferase
MPSMQDNTDREEKSNMIVNGEERILAKGLNAPGPLLIVKRKLKTVKAERLRIIVSNIDAAQELLVYFRERSAYAEIDRAGDDYHVVVNLKNFEGDE